MATKADLREMPPQKGNPQGQWWGIQAPSPQQLGSLDLGGGSAFPPSLPTLTNLLYPLTPGSYTGFQGR